MNVAYLKNHRDQVLAFNELKKKANQIFVEIFERIIIEVTAFPALCQFEIKDYGFEKFMKKDDFPLCKLHQLVIENLMNAGFEAEYIAFPYAIENGVKKPAYGCLQINWEYE